MKDLSYIDRNVEAIMRRIEAAANAVGRRPQDITLLAAVKYADADEIARLYECGIRCVGENRVQQFCEHKQDPRYSAYRVHFIGSLQTNKVKQLVSRVDMIESLDSERLSAEIDKQSKKAGVVTDVLCEINIGREENKTGIFPENVPEFCERLAQYENLRLRGFMTMAPVCGEKGEYRKYFAETYRTALDIWEKNLHNIERPIISMGMSGSFEEAILEGADIVRVGRSLFEKK